MKRKLISLVCGLLITISATAQVTLEGYADIIQAHVRASFPASTMLNQALGQVVGAIGNNGNVVVTGRDASGNLVGSALAASTTASANMDIGTGLSTSVVWVTTIAWKAIEGGDGALHIEITVTWGTNSASYTRVIDAPTNFPNAVMPANTPPPGNGGSSGSGNSGHFELREFWSQYSYFDGNGTLHVVAYSYHVWIWIEDNGNGNQYQY